MPYDVELYSNIDEAYKEEHDYEEAIKDSIDIDEDYETVTEEE